MGYAKLNFATSVTTSQAMYDIVRVVNGTVTSAANLTYASTTSSEIVNTLAQNWTVTYGTVADTTVAYVLERDCATVGKTKYAWLTTNANGTYGGSSAAFSTTGHGIYLNTITAATSATAVSNPAYYYSVSANANSYRHNFQVDATNQNLYLSWSKYHLLLYGQVEIGHSAFSGTFEYPETNLSQFTNSAPVVHYWYSAGATSNFQTLVGLQTTGTVDQAIFQATNVHFPLTNTTSGIALATHTSAATTVTNGATIALKQTWDPAQTWNGSGANVYPLVPLFSYDPDKALPIMNISQLTGVYRISDLAGPVETLYSVGADNYVFLPIGDNTTSTGAAVYAAIAVLKK